MWAGLVKWRASVVALKPAACERDITIRCFQVFREDLQPFQQCPETIMKPGLLLLDICGSLQWLAPKECAQRDEVSKQSMRLEMSMSEGFTIL